MREFDHGELEGHLGALGSIVTELQTEVADRRQHVTPRALDLSQELFESSLRTLILCVHHAADEEQHTVAEEEPEKPIPEEDAVPKHVLPQNWLTGLKLGVSLLVLAMLVTAGVILGGLVLWQVVMGEYSYP